MLSMAHMQGVQLERCHGSTLEDQIPSMGSRMPLHPEQGAQEGSQELGVIHFLAQQLSPDLRQASFRASKHARDEIDEFALDEEDRIHGGIKRGWTEEEENLLVRLVNHHGSHKGKWKLIANSMKDMRTPGQVREKWLRMQREGRADSPSVALSSHSMIGALQAAVLEQAIQEPVRTSANTLVERVVEGQPGVMTPQCHRCHHRKPGRGWASCENGLAHHFCERCVHNSFGSDFQNLLAHQELWNCPVCSWTCPCAACERRSSQHNTQTLSHNPMPAPQHSEDGSCPGKIKKGWSDSDAALLVTLVHKHQDHKNKWKLVAAEMPDARTPGQVKEKYHRMQKLPEFEAMAAKLLQSPTLQTQGNSIHLSQPTQSPQLESKTASEANLLRLMTSQKSASGFRGVSRAGSRWEAYIGNGTAGKRYIGRFDTPREAAIAYAQAYSSQPKQVGSGSSPMIRPRNQGTSNSPKLGATEQRVCAPCKRRRSTVNYCRVQQQHDAPSWDQVSVAQSAPASTTTDPAGDKELVRSSKAASGYMGVAKAGCRWEAYISAGQRGKRFKRYIGCYDTPELAAQAYLDATTKTEREEDDGESDDDDSKEWFSDEYEDARNQVIHTLSSLPSLASVAQETPPDLQLPPQVPPSIEATSSAELLLQASMAMQCCE
eukprot:TRINITY_DN27560_c0_g2_i1.p1 TRINITY_DN27560_c0_g2~~TRINITY_DN27560_c0_g2_i1.p1  ORF type:complete len:660 (-),score=132.11 TRINITY_DN27560_c0_g2_i1:299-2278(-)